MSHLMGLRNYTPIPKAKLNIATFHLFNYGSKDKSICYLLSSNKNYRINSLDLYSLDFIIGILVRLHSSYCSSDWANAHHLNHCHIGILSVYHILEFPCLQQAPLSIDQISRVQIRIVR